VTHAQGWAAANFKSWNRSNLRYDNQIIVNPDAERTAKQAPFESGHGESGGGRRE